MKKGIVALALGFWLTIAAFGQSIDLRGTVKNKAGSAIANVVVTLKSRVLKDTTDA